MFICLLFQLFTELGHDFLIANGGTLVLLFIMDLRAANLSVSSRSRNRAPDSITSSTIAEVPRMHLSDITSRRKSCVGVSR